MFKRMFIDKTCLCDDVVGQIVHLASGRQGGRIRDTTDLIVKTSSDSSTAKRSAIGLGHRSSDMIIINGYPLSQQVWYAKESSLLNGQE